MPLTSTMETNSVPFSRVSGNLLRHTRWMLSHSLYRDRSDAAAQARSGGSGTSTDTDSFAMTYDVGGAAGGCWGSGDGWAWGGVGAFSSVPSTAFLAAP